MRVKRELWRTTMAPARSAASARSAARLATSARLAREKNSDQERKDEIRERERERERESQREYERESPVTKQIIKNFGIAIRTVSYLRRYCSMFQNFETFRTTDET